MIMLPATKNLRIIAVPLTRPKRIPSPTQSNLKRLTYYRFQISSHKLNKAPSPKDSEGKTGNGKSLFGWPKEGVTNWVTKKAAETWAGFGKAQGGWKVCVDLLFLGRNDPRYSESAFFSTVKGLPCRGKTRRPPGIRRVGVEEYRPVSRPFYH